LHLETRAWRKKGHVDAPLLRCETFWRKQQDKQTAKAFSKNIWQTQMARTSGKSKWRKHLAKANGKRKWRKHLA